MLSDVDGYWVQCCGGLIPLLTTCLRRATASLLHAFGTISNCKWGQLHQIELHHPLAKKLGHGPFTVGPYPIGGAATTVNCSSIDWSGGVSDGDGDGDGDGRVFAASLQGGVTLRFVMDVGEWDNSTAVLCPGQSERLSSPHFRDQFDMWLEGDTRPMLWSHEKVLQAAKSTITITPSPSHSS